MQTDLRKKISENSFSLVFHFTSVVLIVAVLLFGGCNSSYVLERLDDKSKDSERMTVEGASEGLSISSERPIYGIITDIGVVEFQAYNSTDSIVTLGMTLIVVTVSMAMGGVDHPWLGWGYH
ncbi:MAG: hypothetical protein KAS73_06475 [Candidatus Sabulitectum sp.]|nr:hypothetical protein [Candidatus Sabulitectum sp.]